MKTTNDILTDIYTIVKASDIVDLSGGIYKTTRPADSKDEDCVINVINGSINKFVQSGALIVKIFFNDILSNATYYEDTTNGAAKETLLFDLSHTILHKSGYFFEFGSRELSIEAVPEIHQHYAVLKMNFKLVL